MKLDVNALRYLSGNEFRVLTAVEMGMKNHEIVPAELIDRIAGLKNGGAYKYLRTLLRHKLVHHDSSKYDGYRLTTLGYDFLAIKTMVNRGLIAGVGRQIGVGKESDIFEVVTEEGETLALKLHRLGRTSFRAVKAKRDYLKHRSSYNWLYLSRLAALKEYAFMKALHEHGFPTPKAVDWNRHCVLMSLVPGYPLVQVKQLKNPAVVFETVIGLIVRLAQHGLIHCDFNEFNLLIDDDENITMIDFPQMVSVSHRNAESYFDRDVGCIYKFFERKLHFVPAENEENERPEFEDLAAASAGTLDKELAASGFTHQNQEHLQQYIEEARNDSEEDVSDSETDSASDSGEGKELTGLEEQLSKTGLGDDEPHVAVGSPGSSDRVESDEEQGRVEDNTEKSLHDKRIQKHRRKSAAAVRGGGSSLHLSRNANKDKGGRRSKHAKARFDL